jgi:hypothetical protein
MHTCHREIGELHDVLVTAMEDVEWCPWPQWEEAENFMNKHKISKMFLQSDWKIYSIV